MYAEILFVLKKLLVEKEHVELLCMLNWSMLNYMRDEIMYVEKLACWFQCISKYLHFEKFVGRTPTFRQKCEEGNLSPRCLQTHIKKCSPSSTNEQIQSDFCHQFSKSLCMIILKSLKDGCFLPNAPPDTDVAGHSVTAGDAGEMPVDSTMRWDNYLYQPHIKAWSKISV